MKFETGKDCRIEMKHFPFSLVATLNSLEYDECSNETLLNFEWYNPQIRKTVNVSIPVNEFVFCYKINLIEQDPDAWEDKD